MDSRFLFVLSKDKAAEHSGEKSKGRMLAKPGWAVLAVRTQVKFNPATAE